VAEDIEQTACRWSAFRKVIGLGGIDVTLPEVVVLSGQHSVVDARELAVYAEDFGRLDACVGWRVGVEDPAVGIGVESVALKEGGGCVGEIVGGEEEEDVVGGDGEVNDNFTF